MGRISKNKILKAIKGSAGIMSTIAKKLDVDWHTAKKHVLKYDVTRQALENEEEAILDMADNALYASVKDKEQWAVKYLLATKGKKRGYVERTEHDHTTKGESLHKKLNELPEDELRKLADGLDT